MVLAAGPESAWFLYPCRMSRLHLGPMFRQAVSLTGLALHASVSVCVCVCDTVFQ